MLDQAPADRPLQSFLDERGINLFYVDEARRRQLSANPAHRSFLTLPESAGWKVLGGQDTASGAWMLLQRQ
jgi:hypothetical protein